VIDAARYATVYFLHGKHEAAQDVRHVHGISTHAICVDRDTGTRELYMVHQAADDSSLCQGKTSLEKEDARLYKTISGKPHNKGNTKQKRKHKQCAAQRFTCKGKDTCQSQNDASAINATLHNIA
jgi:hypothetical protein